VTLTVYAGASRIHVPVRARSPEDAPLSWQLPEAAAPVAMKEIREGWHRREKTVDPVSGETRLEIVDDFGEQELLPHGLVMHSVGREHYRILPDDPLSAVMETHWTESRRRGEWDTRTETYGRLSASASHWKVWGKIEAFEGDQLVFSKQFEEDIQRQLQ
jgi:hypothetical protein